LQRLLDDSRCGSHTLNNHPTGISRGPPGVATPGVRFFWGLTVNRTAFIVDGLNVYHSLRESERLIGRSLYRLDVAALCDSYLHALPGRATREAVFYFSALAHHREAFSPGTVARQVAYFSALESTQVRVHLGQFKARTLRCPRCHGEFVRWEEKETDVAIGTRLLELVCLERCDTVVLVTGDTDLVPAMRAARRLAPAACLVVLQPHRRVNRQLAACADQALTIRAASYARHQFPFS
jgi:uncharacterized LabA/DUF88 family protein